LRRCGDARRIFLYLATLSQVLSYKRAKNDEIDPVKKFGV
jgi:hypothetical protein